MSFKKNSIFYKKEEKNNKVYIYKNKNWFFVVNNKEYSLAPAGIVSFSMSPVIKGANDLIELASKYEVDKKLEKGFYVYFSNEESLDYDAMFELDKTYQNGWVYNVNFKKIKINNILKVYACDYLKLFYNDAPKIVYVTIE